MLLPLYLAKGRNGGKAPENYDTWWCSSVPAVACQKGPITVDWICSERTAKRWGLRRGSYSGIMKGIPFLRFSPIGVWCPYASDPVLSPHRYPISFFRLSNASAPSGRHELIHLLYACVACAHSSISSRLNNRGLADTETFYRVKP